MMGHTQGVKIASRPPRKPMKKIQRSESSVFACISSCGTSFVGCWSLYSHTSGAVHITSLHALKRIGVSSAFAIVMTKESAYSCVNSRSPNSMIDICHPGSIAAFSRTLSPISVADHLAGWTICAATHSGNNANNIIRYFFIFYCLFFGITGYRYINLFFNLSCSAAIWISATTPELVAGINSFLCDTP